MSSDSAKENASVVDSSVTEGRNDIGNSDDPESSGYKFNENINTTRADKGGHSHGQIGHPTGIGVEKWQNIKYFIIKSLNHQNIHLSIEKGIWATQIMNEPILEEAFHNSGSVILIFSVNMSGSFQGYAQMMSSIGRGRDNVWSEGTGKSNPWGRSFKVKWMCLNDLPFHKTLHLKNPLNDYKPVKISRDCQELSPDIGLALCELLDGKNYTDCLPTSLSRDEFSLKGLYANTPSSMGDEDCNFPPLHTSWSMPLPYSALFYQNQPEVNNYHSTNQRISGTMFTEILPTTSESSQVSGIKRSKDVASQSDFWGLSSESPLASTLTEDDFLDMSYEEYLEVHSRCKKQLRTSATKPSWKQLELLRSNSHDDDRNTEDGVDRDRSNSHGRIHQSSLPWI
ncbi:YTH domain-containing protein 1-like isoform X1 [Glycine soja]|uniref:YTH domain-containing family protein n=1 Tax=Glycine soja TaxID=3848 RepID=A0A445M6Y0_GLYSO|nr:YTH domain-containing protein 1-like isoform X1 [Glycine soja]XP_028246830.1 YTH domain-containing protein 1-like isoform X1 [Glycine soja]RZC31140.1 Zinc finger CCCH domain-containing protein 45 isoform A [Glycine soja]RZC31141.1 Zinc finger CCCH domain-containing protein 45 isoform B [Glycine soja]